MLIAHLNGGRVLAAADTPRGLNYRCPKCQAVVVLKKGRIRAYHFAHKVKSDCLYGSLQSPEHEQAEHFFRDAFARAGLRAEIEWFVETLSEDSDRRADVMLWFGRCCVAIELQQTAIGLDSIERRAFSYARAGYAQLWILILPKNITDIGNPIRFSAPPHVRWINGLNYGKGVWFYDPSTEFLWRGKLSDYMLAYDGGEWRDEGGDEHSADGGEYRSKRWKTLRMTGPFRADELEVTVKPRADKELGNYRWPAGLIADLIPKKR